MFLALTWRDHRLRLPKFEAEDTYRILDVRWIQHIWRPDCIFKNAKEIDFQVLFTISIFPIDCEIIDGLVDYINWPCCRHEQANFLCDSIK